MFAIPGAKWFQGVCVCVYVCSSEAVYLSHLAMKRDSSDAKVPQQQRHPLGIVTRAAEYYKRVACQLVQDGDQVTVLPETGTRQQP